ASELVPYTTLFRSLEQGTVERPRLLDPLGTDEERQVPFEDVGEQRLVRVGKWRKRVAVAEVERPRPDADGVAGLFDFERQREAFIGLDDDRQDVRFDIAPGDTREQLHRSRSESHDDARGSFGEALAGRQYQWHAVPAPVVDACPDARICR